MSDFEDLDFDLDEKIEVKSKTPQQSKTPISGASAGPRKNIFFKSTVGPERTEKISVGERAPVREVRDTLANIFGLNPDDFHLSHAGRTMDESAPIGDYGIENGDEVLLIPHSTAG
ncbi:MAG: hypothetical protein EAX86_12250 [Candidatus Heimdallarchaeota archaeon]|nr:hypothetical protein [Candidatus Heimdallarchaeota archaeon]